MKITALYKLAIVNDVSGRAINNNNKRTAETKRNAHTLTVSTVFRSSGKMTLSGEYTLAALNNEKIIEALDLQRNETRFCDVVLRAENEVFPVHRCVLAAASQYFSSMFEEYHFAESRDKEVELHSINPKALRSILNAIYTGILRLDTDIMYSVLSGADHFLMTEVKYACAEFMLMVLKSERSTGEALRIRRSAELYSLTDIQHEADRVIASSFASVARSAAFLESTFEEVLSLLQSDYILEPNEYVFFEAAVAWIRRDPEARDQHLDQIMSCVRFPLIESHLILNSIQKDALIQKSTVCYDYIEDAKRYQLLPLLQSTLQTERTRPRSTSRDSVIYCLSSSGQFKCYITRYDKWYSLASPFFLDSSGMSIAEQDVKVPSTGRHSLLVVSGLVYLCTHSLRHCIEGDHFDLVQIQSFCLETNSWKECSLPSKLDHPTFAMECNNTLYTCSRNAVERYHSDMDSWEVASVSRLSVCQFAVSDENKIYLYAMEDGICQEISMDRPSLVNTRQVMSPNRFVVEILGATKLPNHEVLLSQRTMSGISRKIFSVKSNLWRDGGIYYGHSPMQPRPGQHYPVCFDTADPWEILCDRNEQVLYVLSTKSGLTNVPQTRRETSGQKASAPVPPTKRKTDAVLPFYRVDMADKSWTRLSSLPEFMASSGPLQMCISDGQSSMGNANII